MLADEISPDTCRLWDVVSKKKLDKDRFRKDLGNIIQDAVDRNELNPNLDKAQSVFFLDAVLNRFLKEYHEEMEMGSQQQYDRKEWVSGIATLFIKGFS